MRKVPETLRPHRAGPIQTDGLPLFGMARPADIIINAQKSMISAAKTDPDKTIAETFLREFNQLTNQYAEKAEEKQK
jgi:hypothetical protein